MSSGDGDLKIELKDEQVKAVVAGAIMNLFTDDQREALMKSAIVYLMTPQRTGTYGPEKAPLERIFHDAVQSAARQWFYDRLTDRDKDTPEKKMLQDALTEVFQRLFTDEHRAVVIDRLVDAVATAFEKMRIRDNW
jgi:hypothetical protein